MPIVTGIGGNPGNQTITMIVRAIALGQVHVDHPKKLYAKEIGVSMLNGLIWGGMLGNIAYLLYKSASLGIVMTAAMTLNLTLAAVMGVAVPLAMMRMGRDPAIGSSVMITAVTDSGGLFLPRPRHALPAIATCYAGHVADLGLPPNRQPHAAWTAPVAGLFRSRRDKSLDMQSQFARSLGIEEVNAAASGHDAVI